MFTRPFVRILIGSLCAFILSMPYVTIAAPNPPTQVDETPFTVVGLCDFPLEVELSGKGKMIELPGERTLLTAPGLMVTITNIEDPNQHVTLNITGSYHQTLLDNGNTLTTATGRNIVFGPEGGILLTQGKFTFIADPFGNTIDVLSTNGQVTDVCQLVS